MSLETIVDNICKVERTHKEKYFDFERPFELLFLKNILRESGIGCLSHLFIFNLDVDTGKLVKFTTNKFINCTKEQESSSRYIVHEVIIRWGLKATGHGNIVIVDKENQEWELFEPHGFATWTQEILTPLTLRMDYMYKGFKGIAPLDYCPKIGLQTKTGEEWCSTWGLLYIYLRLHCTTMSRSEILERLLDMKSKELFNFLDKWACYMWNYFDDRGITEILKEFRGIEALAFKNQKSKEIMIRINQIMNTTGDLDQVKYLLILMEPNK